MVHRLAVLKLRPSDLQVMREAAAEVTDERATDLLTTIADVIEEGLRLKMSRIPTRDIQPTNDTILDLKSLDLDLPRLFEEGAHQGGSFSHEGEDEE